ncbi:MAG: alpha/beta fold hydrolase [Deltaproteobacteria bacterium]|nr:alpha/beta fold hydrolase [Deltaproteobacteria bacterium]
MSPRALLATLVWLTLASLQVGCLSHHRGSLPGEPKDATFAEVGGARVRYIDRGQGPAVVLLHGFAASLNTWKEIVKELEPNHRVIALDLKGFGWTDRPEGDYSPMAQAELVHELLDQLGVKETAVVGHSWGAAVALAVAIKRPDRVTRLALYDAWVFEEQLPTTFLWARADGVGELLFGLFYAERPADKMALAFFDPEKLPESEVENVEAALARPGTTAAALAAVRGQRFEELERHYPEIDRPVLLLWGREDRVTPLAYGERLASQLPQAKLEIYPRCGHFPMIEAKAASTTELKAFLALPSPPQPKAAAPAKPAPSPTPVAPTPTAPVPPSATPPEPPPVAPPTPTESPADPEPTDTVEPPTPFDE